MAAVGEAVVVEGLNFSAEGRLEIDGVAIGREHIRSWTDRLVVFEMPAQQESGLIRIVTDLGSSNTVFLSSARDLPRVSNTNRVALSSVEVLVPAGAIRTGSVIRFVGTGFGPPSGLSSLEFAPVRGGEPYEVSQEAVVWSDREIIVAVPATVSPGTVTVRINGIDTEVPLGIAPVLGRATYGPTRRYAVAYAVAVEPSDGAAGVAIFPRAPVVPQQPQEQLLRESVSGSPTLLGRGVRYEITAQPEESLSRVERAVLIDRRTVSWELDAAQEVSSEILLDPAFRLAFARYLAPERDVPSTDPAITELRRRLVNVALPPVEIARSVHRAVLATLSAAVSGTSDVGAALSGEAASSEAYATLAVALARASGLPARRHRGLIIDDGGQARPHTWMAYFLPGTGWIPADPAVGDGVLGDDGASVLTFYGDDPASATFAALDDRRVLLSMDGLPVTREHPFGVAITPDPDWAGGAVRVEFREAATPFARWAPPSVVAQF